MSYRFKRRESVEDGVRRILSEQARASLRSLSDDELPDAERIHRARQCCKRARGLLRLVQHSLGGEFDRVNHAWRNAARLLSDRRDADVVIRTFASIMGRVPGEEAERFREVLAGLERNRLRLSEDLAGSLRIVEAFSTAIRAIDDRIDDIELEDGEFKALQGGFKRAYADSRKWMAKAYADGSPASFHRWRKAVKQHWYHIRLLTPVWPRVLAPMSKALDELGEGLGQAHDQTVLRALLEADPESFGGPEITGQFVVRLEVQWMTTFVATRQIASRLFDEQPAMLVKRFHACWNAWRSE